MIVFVEKFPARCHFDENIAANGSVITIAKFGDVIAVGQQSFAGENVAHTCILDQEVLTATQHLTGIETFLLDEIAIEINFVVETSLHVTSLTVNGTEIDVE